MFLFYIIKNINLKKVKDSLDAVAYSSYTAA